MYDPSIAHDESSAHEYGGYKSNDICEVASNDDLASTEDLTESKQRFTRYNSNSSLTKLRQNFNDTPLNFDDTEPESDDDDDDEDGFKRVKSSDDKRIFVKELNYVKGRQVGLLIGPFGKFNERDQSSRFAFFFFQVNILLKFVNKLEQKFI